MTGRVLGVDPGQARIGLALSDPLGLTAQPVEHLERIGSRRDLNNIASFSRENEVHTIVIGLPLALSGAEGEAAGTSRQMAEGLKLRLPEVRIELWDERLTTVQAERVLVDANVRRKKRRRRIDSLAACLILQSWLDAQAFRQSGAE